jgi:antitoxin component YwqK of YwqJK toxin-antitoxin module
MRTFFGMVCTLLSVMATAQSPEETILYVVDGIPVVEEAQPGETALGKSDIETISVVTDKSKIEQYGYKNISKIMFVVTKEYSKRSHDVRNIPSTKQMDRNGPKWYLKDSNAPYSGPFIDYYTNGKKKGEGTLADGELEGARVVYYQNGNKKYERHYSKGIEEGENTDYFMDGQIRQKGNFKNGRQDGVWQQWYSTGKLKWQTQFKDGTSVMSKDDKNLSDGLMKFSAQENAGNYADAIKAVSKTIEQFPDYSDLYFNRGTAYLKSMKFDEAIGDFDKAIELEPLYMEALSNRAIARLMKYQMKNGTSLSKSHDVTVVASKDEVDIPKEEQDKVCSDLNNSLRLGDTAPMILEARNAYCK